MAFWHNESIRKFCQPTIQALTNASKSTSINKINASKSTSINKINASKSTSINKY